MGRVPLMLAAGAATVTLAGATPARAEPRSETCATRVVARDREIAALDRAYWREVTEVLRELRGRELVTEQRLINARFSLARAEVELRAWAERQRACEKALAAGAAADRTPRAAGAGGGE